MTSPRNLLLLGFGMKWPQWIKATKEWEGPPKHNHRHTFLILIRGKAYRYPGSNTQNRKVIIIMSLLETKELMLFCVSQWSSTRPKQNSDSITKSLISLEELSIHQDIQVLCSRQILGSYFKTSGKEPNAESLQNT